MILGLAGLAGSGKSAVADALVQRRGFTCVGIADPLKRICQDVFGWSHDRLWGPSEARNAPDPRWGGLTARRALQQLGTNWGRAMHPDVWVRAALETARSHRHVVIPDVRFQNEVDAIVAAGGRVFMVTRPIVTATRAHASERPWELTGLAGVVLNNGTLDELRTKALGLVTTAGTGFTTGQD